MADRAELHDPIHERDRASAAAEDRREVHRDRRLARPALRRVADDHLSLEAQRFAPADRERRRELVGPTREDEDRVDRLIGLRVDWALRHRDDHDPATGRRGPHTLGEIESGDLSLEERVDHDGVRFLRGHPGDRRVRLALRADELGFLLAGEHLLQVLRDLRQVRDGHRPPR